MMRLNDSEFKLPYTDRWFIWGMPYSGKSSLGKKIRKIIPFPVIDLDREVQRKYIKSPAEIINKEGEEVFRSIESEVLKEVVLSHEKFCLITGGGTPILKMNADFMIHSGNCLFMDTPFPKIIERFLAKSKQERPLLDKKDELGFASLYDFRLNFYRKAHAHFLSEKEAIIYFSQLY